MKPFLFLSVVTCVLIVPSLSCFPSVADFGVSAQITATLAKRKSFIGTPYWLVLYWSSPSSMDTINVVSRPGPGPVPGPGPWNLSNPLSLPQDGSWGGSSGAERRLQPAVWYLGRWHHCHRAGRTAATHVWPAPHEVCAWDYEFWLIFINIDTSE